MIKISLKAALVAGLTALGATPVLAQGQHFDGVMNVIWGDPRAGAGGETRFSIALPDGRTLPLLVSPADTGKAITAFGKHVSVDGSMTTDARGQPAIAASNIQASEDVKRGATVTRKVIFLLLKFKDDANEPHPKEWYLDLTNPKKGNAALKIPATVNGFFNKTSWKNLQWQGDVTNWMVLPFNKAHYANCGWDTSCANLNALSNDAFTLAVQAGVDLKSYDNINFVLNNDLDCCAWGGGTSFQGKQFGATWEPPWGQEAGTYSHEFGHSIGLPHSGWTYYAYDSPWDIMSMRTSAKSVVCATYFSANDNAQRNVTCTEPGDGYIAAHKDYLGWTPASNVVTINAKGTTKVVLEANALPLKSKTKLIKICLAGEACTGSGAHYVSVEARIDGKKYEAGLTGDGVIIQDVKLNRGAIGGHCYFNNQSGFAVPIDATPGDYDSSACNSGGRTWPNYGLGNAQWLPGQTYTDSTHKFSVKVQKKKGKTYVVKITQN